jgi:hypothetical protein
MPRYRVVDQPFYDNAQLHPVGSEVEWDGPKSKALEPVGSPRKSETEAPVFPDPKVGRPAAAPKAEDKKAKG